tara:strand:+ start:102 stop:950 length:849 start_codon:yes stop_codon:yes gene_type:complete
MKTYTKVKIAKLIFNILILFGFKKKILIKRSSIKWYLDLSEGIDLSIFLFGSFQGDVVKSILKTIIHYKGDKNSNFNIIDVGSNIGDKSLSLSKKLIDKNFFDFKIFSVEPTDYAFKKQIKNINLNPNLKKKIFPFKFYISKDKLKPKKIYSSWKLDVKTTPHKVHRGLLKKINDSTKSISLDEFVKKNKIKKKIILKIDVDGFELDVLKSFVKTLKNENPIIFMEYAPYALEEYGSSVIEFNNFLKKYKYKVYDLNFKKIDSIQIADGSSKDIILIKDKLI